MQRDEFVIENERRRSFTIDFSYETLSIADLFKFVQTVQKLTLFKIYNSLDGRRNVTRCIKPSAETLGKLSKKRASSRRDLPTNPFPTHNLSIIKCTAKCIFVSNTYYSDNLHKANSYIKCEWGKTT